MSTSIMTEAQAAAYKHARSMNTRPAVASLPIIGLKSSEKKEEGLKRGNFYVETYDGENKVRKDIGPRVELVILDRFYTYHWYNEEAGELAAWTGDIRGFDISDAVALYRKKAGKAVLDFFGNYKEFKSHKESAFSYTDKDGRKKNYLKFQHSLYVIFNGELHRLHVKMTGAVGVPPGTNIPDFDNVQSGSLEHFITTTRGAEMEMALCEFKCVLGSRFVDDVSQPFYIMTFANGGKLDEDPRVAEHYLKVQQMVGQSLQAARDVWERQKQEPVRADVVDASPYEGTIADQDFIL